VARASKPRERTVGTLDIGSSKIMCLVAEVTGAPGARDQKLRVLGSGVQRSQGITAGVVTDPKAAEDAIRAAVATAERTAGVTLDQVMVSITSGRQQSTSFAARAEIRSRWVKDADIVRLMSGAQAYAERDGRALLHMNRKRFLLDGAPAGDDPRGMAAAILTAEMHAVTIDESATRNIVHVVERCHLAVGGLVSAPYASALAVTHEEQRRLGVTVIDLGGGTTSVAVFADGQFVYGTIIASGGQHLTFEIAQNLHASLAEAERIKSLYASIVNAPSDIGDRFSYSVLGESEASTSQTTRARLAGVVKPRVEHLLREVAARLDAAGATGPVVLTGGASQLVGVAEFAAICLGREVWRGRPYAALGGSAATESPAGSTAVGLALAAPDGQRRRSGHDGRRVGYFGRVGEWIASSF
jgi:cell division protein FtsA